MDEGPVASAVTTVNIALSPNQQQLGYNDPAAATAAASVIRPLGQFEYHPRPSATATPAGASNLAVHPGAAMITTNQQHQQRHMDDTAGLQQRSTSSFARFIDEQSQHEFMNSRSLPRDKDFDNTIIGINDYWLPLLSDEELRILSSDDDSNGSSLLLHIDNLLETFAYDTNGYA